MKDPPNSGKGRGTEPGDYHAKGRDPRDTPAGEEGSMQVVGADPACHKPDRNL